MTNQNSENTLKQTVTAFAQKKAKTFRTLEVLCAVAGLLLGGDILLDHAKGKGISDNEFHAMLAVTVGGYVAGWRQKAWEKRQKDWQNA